MTELSATQQIDSIIAKHNNWQGEALAQFRKLILQTDPTITEEVKWKTPSRPEGLATWTYHKMICFAEIWKDNIKLIFMHGSQLQDEHKLFNARLKSESVRAIEMREGDSLNQAAFSQLVTEAIELQKSSVK